MSASESVYSLRWGIMGCGMISNDFVRSLGYCKNLHQVAAVATANCQRRATAFRDSLELGETTVKAYGSYEELLADPNVDIVYVGNLNDTHCAWTLRALEAGKPVLCEKPMGVTAAQVRQMAAKARDTKLFLMEAFWSRFFPSWQYIRDVIDTKKYGAVKLSGANFGIPLPESRHNIEQGETPLMDIGVYTIMFAMFVNSKTPKSVHVTGAKNGNGSDIWANITLDFGDGSQALCYYNGSACGTNSAFVSFEKGQIQLPEFFWAPTRLFEFETPVKAGVTKPKLIEFPLNDEEGASKFVYNNSSGLRYEADHVFECIRQGKLESDVVSLDESIRIHEIVEEIRRQLGVVFSQDNEK